MRLFVDFDGVMCYAKVFVNGHCVGEHTGGYVPFSVEITQQVEYGDEERNVLAVYVDSTERADIPPFGGAVDYLCYGGIYRDVTLRAVPQCHIESMYAHPLSVLSAEKSLAVDVVIAHGERTDKSIDISVALFDSRNRKRAELSRILTVSDTALSLSMILDELTGLKLWTLEKPELYRVEVSLLEDGFVRLRIEPYRLPHGRVYARRFFLKRQAAQAARFKSPSIFSLRWLCNAGAGSAEGC